MFRVLSTYRTLTFPDFGPSGSPSLRSSLLIFADFFFPMLFFVCFFYEVIAYNYFLSVIISNYMAIVFVVESAIIGLQISQRNIWFSLMKTT